MQPKKCYDKRICVPTLVPIVPPVNVASGHSVEGYTHLTALFSGDNARAVPAVGFDNILTWWYYDGSWWPQATFDGFFTWAAGVPNGYGPIGGIDRIFDMIVKHGAQRIALENVDEDVSELWVEFFGRYSGAHDTRQHMGRS